MSHDNGCQDSPNMMPETGSELGRFILIERSGGHRRSSKLTFSGQTQIVPVPGPDLTADIGDLPCGEINGALRTPMLARAAGLFVGCPTHRWTPRAQRRPCALAIRTSSTAACCSACFFFATSFSVVVIRRQPFPPGSRPARQARNTVWRTVPVDGLECIPHGGVAAAARS